MRDAPSRGVQRVQRPVGRFVRTVDLDLGGRLEGASPPAVFVGRFGYPKVAVGPLVPPLLGDTSLYDSPESWLRLSMQDIVAMRTTLVRGKFPARVTEPEARSPLLDATRELALAREPRVAEAEFRKPPRGAAEADGWGAPNGPSASLVSCTVATGAWDPRLEKAYHDTDHRAGPAVVDLYRAGVPVSRIQRAFSIGTMGVARDRRIVPTRWSITAVDDTLGEALRARNAEANRAIEDVRVHRHSFLGSTWVVLLLPGAHWRYELVEAWYPGTAFNLVGSDVDIVASHEFSGPARAAAERRRRGAARTLFGRRSGSDYAQIGGCFYAARLAIQEHFERERVFGGAVVLRECDSGHYLPLGVWEVREAVREALRGRAERYAALPEALPGVWRGLRLPREAWLSRSVVLRSEATQARLEA